MSSNGDKADQMKQELLQHIKERDEAIVNAVKVGVAIVGAVLGNTGSKDKKD